MNEVGGSCFPTITQLCDESGMSKPTVIKSIRQAVERGWLEKKKAGFAGQRWMHNTYKATIPDKAVNDVNQLVDNPEKAVNVVNKGGKRQHQKAVNPVDTSTSVNSSNSSSTQNPVDKSRVQNRAEALAKKMRMK